MGKITVADAWGYFQINELRDPAANRSETTISRYLELFEKNILPEWGNVPLDEVKTVRVEKWLRSLPYANGTRAKFRNVLCLLFNHAIRCELYDKNLLVPIEGIRRSAEQFTSARPGHPYARRDEISHPPHRK